jgi:ribosomal protein L33
MLQFHIIIHGRKEEEHNDALQDDLDSRNRLIFVGEKSTKHATRKLALRKYDPLVNRYVLFTEQKLKK